MNAIFLGLVAVAFGIGAWRQVFAPATADGTPMHAMASAILEQAAAAVTLALGLAGVMALFLGVMKIAEAGGMLAVVARLVRPLLQRLFKDVPGDHPAMGAIVLNISANTLGLGNAATPFGIRAMEHLKTLATSPGVATNAMVLFLAINTSSVTLVPTTVIALRAAAGSADPAGILPTTLFATMISTLTAISVALLGARWWPAPSPVEPPASPSQAAVPPSDVAASPTSESGDIRVYPVAVSFAALAGLAAVVPLAILYGSHVAPWLIPSVITGLIVYGGLKGVPVYEAFVEGAREGFSVAVRIIPYLVAILVAVGMLRASGAIDVLVAPIGSLTARAGLPTEALIMAMLRTLSGSGAFAYLASVLSDPAIGPDSYTGYLVSTIQGSTETTFYVLAVYFGSIGVVRFRHAVAAGVCADLAGFAASVVICQLVYA